MLTLAVRGVREHLVRFALSVLAVTLGVAFVAGTFALRQMLASTFDDIVATTVTADAYVQPPGATTGDPGAAAPVPDGAAAGVPLDLVPEVEALPGVATVTPALQGTGVLVGADGTAVGSGGAPTILTVLDPGDGLTDRVVGRTPAAAGEVVLESAALARSGLAVGDATRLVVLGELRDVRVVGEVDVGPATAGATLVFLERGAAQALFAPDGTVPSLAVHAAAGTSPETLVGRLSGLAADAGAVALTGEQVRADATAAVREQLGFVSAFLLVFAAVALFVGAFLIANTFTMSVRQRLREFALLRAVGASPAQVFGSIVAQAAVVGLLGSALGVAGGIGLVAALRALLAGMGAQLAGRIPVDAATVGVSLAVGTLVSVAAAALPARRAALTPPVEAMREVLSVRERSLRPRTAAGALLGPLGAGAVALAAARPDEDAATALLATGAGLVLVAVLLLGPVVAPAAIRVLAAPAVALLRPVGRLARGNVTRNPRRTASTAGALTIGMALVGAASVLAASAQGSTTALVQREVTADFVLRAAPGTTVGPTLGERVAAVTGVASASGLPVTVVTATRTDPAGGDRGAAAPLTGVDPELLGTGLRIQDGGTVAAALRDGDLAVHAALAEDRGWAVGDTLVLAGAAGERTARIGALHTSDGIGRTLVLPAADLPALQPAAAVETSTLLVTTAEGADPERVRAGLVAAVRPYVVVSVLDGEEFVSSLADQVDRVLVILYALLGLSVVIAVLGIVNTLALSVIERTREIGLLRAVGLGRLQLAGTITVESVLTAVTGTLVGLAVGVGLASALPRVYADEGLSELVVPWSSLGAMVALAVVVGVLAAVWPAVRAARLPVLDAVGQE
ncbi:ABC transporter permease [Cellulomonas endophytica]|uniref:ABC transporter permease n=1 Tax=Cellulomonas endophytica TaxID=2494735 RepID=UPI001011E8F9|nr:ABC transporter permease [Cellulomonas endophytica]